MTPLEFFGLFIITGMVLVIIGWGAAEWGKKCLAQANEYEEYHDKLKIKINRFTVNQCNYRILLNQFKTLGNMKWQDKDRTTDLFVEFAEKFKSVATK